MRQPLQPLTRDDSQVIKGLAILLMIMHHVLIPEFYLNAWSSLNGFVCIHIRMCGKLCVGIFAFVTAYGYAFTERRDLKYSLNHIVRLLKIYWPICIFTVILSVLYSHQFDLKEVLLNLFGLSNKYNCANWYVYFYIYSMLILPLIAKLIDSFKVRSLLVIVLLCGITCSILEPVDIRWVRILCACLFYTPVLVAGYFFGKIDWSTVKYKFSVMDLILILAFGLIVSALFYAFFKGFTPFTFTAPMVIFSVAALFRRLDLPHLYGFLKRLGQLSSYMWFIHAIFFSTKTRMIFQQQSFWPDNIILVYLFVTVISFVIATLIVKIKSSLKTM